MTSTKENKLVVNGASSILRSFYHPHLRRTTQTTNSYVDPHTGEVVDPPSLTKQEFVEQCDINNIIKSYKITGQITHMSAKATQGAYLDLPAPLDFQESLNMVMAAENSFATLPSQVRERFQNSPAEFLIFMADPKNQDEIIKMGLASDSRPPAPPTAPPAPPPPAPSQGPPEPAGSKTN